MFTKEGLQPYHHHTSNNLEVHKMRPTSIINPSLQINMRPTTITSKQNS